MFAVAALFSISTIHAQDAGAPGGDGPSVSAPSLANPEQEFLLGDPLPAAATGGGGEIFVIVRMVLVLAMAAAAVYGVVYFLRRASRPQASRNPHLKILVNAHLGSNRYVYVISVGTKAWLVGAGEGGVNLLAEIEDQEAVDAMLLDESRQAAEPSGSRLADFGALLRRLGGNRGGTPGGGFSADILRQQRERLKGL